MQLPLDHVPFYSASDQALRGFRSLGFTISPDGYYTSSEFPDVKWPTNCVFLQQGWFDLLRDERLDPDRSARPGGCLFRTANLDQAMQPLADVHVTARYSLQRQWQNATNPGEKFELAAYEQSPCELPLALIAHHWPCDDVSDHWTEHPNGARRLQAVVCQQPATSNGNSARPFIGLLDTSQAITIARDGFAQRFGADKPKTAVLVKVNDLVATDLVLQRSKVKKSFGITPLLPFRRFRLHL